MANAGITYSAAAENIAAGYATAADVMNGWMNSQGHRDNILNANFTEIGIGIRDGGDDGDQTPAPTPLFPWCGVGTLQAMVVTFCGLGLMSLRRRR